MKKPLKIAHPKLKLTILVIVIAALIIGFMSGQYYSTHIKQDNAQPSLGTVPYFCNCPNIPVNATPAEESKSCTC
jgi:hypothetical protein